MQGGMIPLLKIGFVFLKTFFPSLVVIFIITFFDVCKKLNNHILQYSGLKCTYDIEPLQIYCYILQSFNELFSKRNPMF